MLASPSPEVVARSIQDLVYHADVAEWVAADVINIHGGGAYGDKRSALKRLTRVIGTLPESVTSRLTLENDDRVYTPADLLPVCHATGISLVYDVHHHRCLPDGQSVDKSTAAAVATWNREPLFHLSSPLSGWTGRDNRPHHDYIDPADFPDCWKHRTLTIDLEAKAKELAVLKFRRWMLDNGVPLSDAHGSPVA